MKERMILFTFLVAACSLILRAVDVVEVTAAGKEAVRYAAIEDALGTCSGGETLTLLGDVAVPGKLEISKSVTVDLAGYTLKNGSGWFICPTEDVGTLSFRNGTITSGDCCFAFGDGAYTVSVSNVVFNGNTVLYAYRDGSTLEFQDDCCAQMRIRFVTFASSRVRSRCIFRGGVVAGKIYDDQMSLGNLLTVYGGSFDQDPTTVLAPGYVVEEGTHEVQGVTCSYRVRAANDDERGVATVTCVDGVVRGCAALDMALASCAPGGAVTLLEDCTASFPIALDKAMTLDLNGHALCRSRSGALFAPPTGAAGMTVRNGRCEAADVLLGRLLGLLLARQPGHEGLRAGEGALDLGVGLVRLLGVLDRVHAAQELGLHLAVHLDTLGVEVVGVLLQLGDRSLHRPLELVAHDAFPPAPDWGHVDVPGRRPGW